MGWRIWICVIYSEGNRWSADVTSRYKRGFSPLLSWLWGNFFHTLPSRMRSSPFLPLHFPSLVLIPPGPIPSTSPLPSSDHFSPFPPLSPSPSTSLPFFLFSSSSPLAFSPSPSPYRPSPFISLFLPFHISLSPVSSHSPLPFPLHSPVLIFL